MTERDVRIQHMRERTSGAAVRKRAAAVVRKPCMFENHDFIKHNDTFNRCTMCGLVQVKTLRKAPRRCLRNVRALVEPVKNVLPSRLTGCVDVWITNDLAWRTFTSSDVAGWALLVKIPNGLQPRWEVAGHMGVTTYDYVIKATTRALAADDATPRDIYNAVRNAVYGVIPSHI